MYIRYMYIICYVYLVHVHIICYVYLVYVYHTMAFWGHLKGRDLHPTLENKKNKNKYYIWYMYIIQWPFGEI